VFVADGDSITQSGGDDPWPSLLNEPTYTIHNIAVDGETLATMLANYQTFAAQWFKPGVKNVISIWGGTNDLAGTGATPAQTYALLTQYIAAAHATGFKVITSTMLSRACCDALKDQYNPLILANTGGAQGTAGQADQVVSYTNTPLGIDGGYANPEWFQGDEIHPTLAAKQTYIVPLEQAAINVF
jgi:hypothetical protein